MSAPIENKNAVGNEGGAPSKYKKEYAQQAFKLCLLGFTDKKLAAFFEVNEDTIYEWKNTHAEFRKQIKKAKDQADAEVAASMYKRAVGFEFNEITFEKIDTKEVLEATDEEKIIVDLYRKKVVRKFVVPDVGAQMNWLKNRQRELWKDRTETEITGKDGEALLAPMTDKQFQQFLQSARENKTDTGE